MCVCERESEREREREKETKSYTKKVHRMKKFTPYSLEYMRLQVHIYACIHMYMCTQSNATQKRNTQKIFT